MLMVAANGFHGLFIELKAAGKKANPVQRAIHAELEAAGYKVAVVDSVTDFKATVNAYLGKKSAK